MKKCYDESCRVKVRSERKVLSQTDFAHLKNAMRMEMIRKRHTEEGLTMCEENKNQRQHLKQEATLNKQLSSVPKCNFEKSLNSTGTFLKKLQNHTKRIRGSGTVQQSAC